MECKYYLVFKGQEYTFDSEQELDQFIWNNQDIFEQYAHSLLAIKDAIPDSKVIIDKIESLHSKSKSMADRSNTGTTNIHVTDLWSAVNPLSWKSKTDYKVYWISEYLKTTPDATKEQAEKAYEDFEKDEGARKTKTGSEFHEFMEKFIAGDESAAAPSSSSKDAASKFKDYLGRTFGVLGRDYFVLTERSMSSNNISSGIKTILSAVLAAKYNITKDNAEILLQNIVGTADLILVTSGGEIHIFDYKTTSKNFPVNWNTDPGSDTILSKQTRTQYEAQVWTYAAMLESNSIKPAKGTIKTHLVGFHRDSSYNIDSFIGIQDFNTSSQIKQRVYSLFNLYSKINTGKLDDTHNITKAWFGDQAYVTKKAEAYQASIDDFVNSTTFFKETQEGSELKKAGYNYRFYDAVDKKYVGVKDKYTDGRTELEKYVTKLNEANATRLVDLGHEIGAAKSKEDFFAIVRGAFPHTNATFCNELSKYIASDWELVQDDALFSDGIFLFRNGLRYELVMIDTSANSLFYQPKLRKGKSILGNFLSDSAVGSDNRFHMVGNIGNMLIMKGAAFISTNADLFKTAKVSRIIALNPGNETAITTAPNGWIVKNFNTLTRMAGLAKKDSRIRGIEGLLMKDEEAALTVAEDYLQDLSYNSLYNNLLRTVQSSKDQYTIEKLREILQKLKTNADLDQTDPNVMRAVAELYKAILWVDGGYAIATERDIKKYGSIFTFAGGFVAPFAQSPSANLRLLNEINISFTNRIATEVQIKAAKWQKLYEECNVAKWTGGEWEFFMRWFEHDSAGNITSDFKIRDFSDSFWRSNPKEKEMAQYMLDLFWNLRTGQDPTDSDRGQAAYYEVPLCEASNLEIASTTGGFKGVRNVIWKSIKQLIDVGQETINGQRINISRSNENLDVPIIKSGYFEADPAKRKDKLTDPKKGPGYFEKNLDLVFLYVVTSGVKQRLSETFMPLFTGVRALLSIENEFGNAHMTDIAETIDAYISTVVFNKSLIPEELRLLSRLLGKLRGLVSKGILSFSSVSVVREMLSNKVRFLSTKILEGQKGHEISTDGNSKLLYGNFKLADFESAYWDMLSGALEGFRSNSFDYQLNAKFRIANMSYREIPHRLRMNKYGLRNLGSDFMYLNVMAPDYIIRNAMLKATLMNIGAYEAYYVDKDGILQYDMTKDKRFSLLFKYKQGDTFSESDYDHVSESDKAEYKKQEGLYRTSLESWRKQAVRLEWGDFLPEALDPSQQVTLKTQSDKLYGNFDDESKALIQRTLLGGMFFQFKTYGLSNMFNYMHPMTSTNILQLTEATDADGERYWIVKATPEEVAEGYDPYYEVAESELTEDERRRGWPKYEYMGMPNEGKMQSMWKVLKSFAQGDKEALQELWNNQRQRANLYLILHDSFLFVLIAGLIHLLMGDEKIDNLTEQDYWTRWAYTVAMGVAQDGPFWEVASSLWSDGEIPAFRTLQRWSSSAISVINGNTKLGYAVMSNIGATREMTSWVAKD